MGAVEQYLSGDHRRLEEILGRALRPDNQIDPSAFWEFREGLLRHIGIEEKILLPAARKLRGGDPLPEAARLRVDHSALASLLVLTPTVPIVNAIRTILDRHNAVEELENGVYVKCERLPEFNADQILLKIQNAPSVAMAPYSDSTVARLSAENALKRAGYDLKF